MLKASDLLQFTGSDFLIRHLGALITPGVAHLANNAQCWWLVDIITSHVTSYKPSFLLWTLQVRDTGRAVVTAQEDLGERPVFTVEVEFSDYLCHSEVNPLRLYQCGNTVMLPSEY
jgi:hypothetical protein